MDDQYTIFPIGVIRKEEGVSRIEIDAAYGDAFLGLEEFSHIYVLYWFHENDRPDKRQVLQVHPRRDKGNPLTGVFATHSPLRPNLIALTLCKIRSIEATVITVDDIDARSGTPVVDIKCYIPSSCSFEGLRLPDWV